MLFECGNFGYGYTYHHHALFVRIDHVFIHPKFVPLNAEIHKLNYSDHYPVITNFYIPKQSLSTDLNN